MIQIINDCAHLPRGAIGQVRRSLTWVNPVDLDGVNFIRLWGDLPPLTEQSPNSLRVAQKEGHKVFGLYKPAEAGLPAHIMLVMNSIYWGVPSIYWRTGVPTLLIARNLAHEVAHHLVAKRGYIFEHNERRKKDTYEEVMADSYAAGVIRNMQRRWYYRLAQWLIKDLADHHYIAGMLDWKEENYKAAAEHWHKAWCLNRDLKEAWYWYERAKAMSSPE
ncbi:MAG TPA: hypothetical protein VKA60_13610 [Blastocatellia bacterium]|nr:hypothetical protein [Blastocatellia bacterium]